MQVFAYLRQKKEEFKKTNLVILQEKQYRKDLLKTIFVVFCCFASIVTYAIVVNISSTKGYFLTEAQDEKKAIQFSYNIETLNMGEYRNTLRDTLEGSSSIEKIKFNIDLVQSQTIPSYAYKND